jgi:hypothetical protein
MKISELPEELRQKALKYQREETSENFSKETDDLNCAFDWDNTKENYVYWTNIYHGDFPKPDKLQRLIEWMEAEVNKVEKQFSNPNMLMDKSSGIYYGLTQCINKAKEIQKGN